LARIILTNFLSEYGKLEQVRENFIRKLPIFTPFLLIMIKMHKLQKIFFQDHLDLALATGKPIVIHNRDADQDVMQQVLEHGNSRGVFHCWPAGWDIAKPLIDKGYHLSFTGTVTFKKNEMVQDVASRIPLERLMLETDSPFLTPVPHRGKRPNEPKYIPHIAEKIAELRGITVEELARKTTGNAEAFFKF